MSSTAVRAGRPAIERGAPCGAALEHTTRDAYAAGRSAVGWAESEFMDCKECAIWASLPDVVAGATGNTLWGTALGSYR